MFRLYQTETEKKEAIMAKITGVPSLLKFAVIDTSKTYKLMSFDQLKADYLDDIIRDNDKIIIANIDIDSDETTQEEPEQQEEEITG